VRFLIDTNIVIKLEPDEPANAEADAVLAMEINRLIGRGDHSLLVHPAIHHDLERDSNEGRAERTRFLLQKYHELADPPDAEALANALGRPVVGSNDWVDNQLIAAVADELVDFLITEDYGLLRKLGRVARREKGLNIQEALDALRSLYDEPLEPPPAVNAVFMHNLDRTDPIWESFRDDYPEFDKWFNRARQGERLAWTINPDDRLAGVAIVKREANGPFGLEGRQLKITTFKVADEYVGRRYGELLLKSVFRHANQNDYDGLYVTVLEKYDGLTALLEDFGFVSLDHRTDLGELVLHKRLKPDDQDLAGLEPLRFHVIFGPPAIHPGSMDWFVVPIEPAYEEMLFPTPGQTPAVQPTLPGLSEWARADGRPSGFGNAIKKAYLSLTSSRLVSAGAVLLFYRSSDMQAVRAVGVVEEVFVSRDPDAIAAFVSARTVYSLAEITAMADERDVVSILFRHDRNVTTPISLKEMISEGALLAAPQSITSLRAEGEEWIATRIHA
jgi:L-amino acid N-acyltransferase YncA